MFVSESCVADWQFWIWCWNDIWWQQVKIFTERVWRISNNVYTPVPAAAKKQSRDTSIAFLALISVGCIATKIFNIVSDAKGFKVNNHTLRFFLFLLRTMLLSLQRPSSCLTSSFCTESSFLWMSPTTVVSPLNLIIRFSSSPNSLEINATCWVRTATTNLSLCFAVSAHMPVVTHRGMRENEPPGKRWSTYLARRD